MIQTEDITIITASFNSSKFLEQCIDSISHQTILPKKHLIIDDGSTDNSLSIAKNLEQKYPHIKVLQNSKNLGYPATLNIGIQNSKTAYIGILDSDDIAYKDWIEATTQFLNKHPEFGLVGGAGNVMTEIGEVTNYIVFNYKKGEITNEIKNNQSLILHPGTVYKKALIEQISGYNENLNSLEDRDMFINFSFKSRIYHLQRPLVYYRRQRASESIITEDFKQISELFLSSKLSYLHKGMSIKEANKNLDSFFFRLKKTTRLKKLNQGSYEWNIFKIFFLKKNIVKSIKYLLITFSKLCVKNH